jgi:hypothetical protein
MLPMGQDGHQVEGQYVTSESSVQAPNLEPQQNFLIPSSEEEALSTQPEPVARGWRVSVFLYTARSSEVLNACHSVVHRCVHATAVWYHEV